MENLSIPNLFSVKGRVALVTGGSSGVGFMIAKVKRLHICCGKMLTFGGTGPEWSQDLRRCFAH